jgi:hypothetical protein
VYPENVSIISALRALRRKLTPPGNRGSLDTEYRQPNSDGTHVTSSIHGGGVKPTDEAGRF